MSFNPTKEAHAKALAEAAEIVVQQEYCFISSVCF
jgi:hypothetical protein